MKKLVYLITYDCYGSDEYDVPHTLMYDLQEAKNLVDYLKNFIAAKNEWDTIKLFSKEVDVDQRGYSLNATTWDLIKEHCIDSI